MSLCLRERAPWFLWPFAALFDALGALVDQGLPLVTVIGPGGVGKTALAVAVATARFPGTDLVFCDLSQASTAEELAAALHAAIGTEPEADSWQRSCRWRRRTDTSTTSPRCSRASPQWSAPSTRSERLRRSRPKWPTARS